MGYTYVFSSNKLGQRTNQQRRFEQDQTIINRVACMQRRTKKYGKYCIVGKPTCRAERVKVIEEVWRKKPRQTDVVVIWGKIAVHNAHASIQTV